LITEATASELFELADSLYKDPVYSELLGSHRRMSERSLVGHRGVIRPDVVFRNGEGFVVIDFKTGKPDEKDEEQVREYLSLLKSAWNAEGMAYLLYLPEGRRVSVFEGSNEQGQLF
jgi:CRISPR/Cas system-associated exonuclease Cas4 (RecB family)